MDALQVFETNSTEYNRLQKLCDLLNQHISETNKSYEVKVCYFDAGQDWLYTTIIATNLTAAPTSCLRTYQALTPKQQELIIADDIDTVYHQLYK